MAVQAAYREWRRCRNGNRDHFEFCASFELVSIAFDQLIFFIRTAVLAPWCCTPLEEFIDPSEK
jgi:hypothetical protein